MGQFTSRFWKFATFAGVLGALGCSGGGAGAPSDAERGSEAAAGSAKDLPVGSTREWQLDAAVSQPAILEGAQVQRTAEQAQEGNLLYEIRLSDTKVVQFLEPTPGEIAVSYTGSDELDALPPAEYATLSPTELFTKITGEAAPERLASAEFAAAARDALRVQSGVDQQVSALAGGPETVGLTAHPNQEFLASQWWIQTACSAAGIDYHFNLNGEYYHRYVGCWADLFTSVHTGDLGVTLDFRVVWDGTNGAVGTMKYWYVDCETFLIEVCNWENKNYTTNAGFWRQLNFFGHQSRAADYSNPNGGYFAVKYNAPLGPQGQCISPVVDCLYHNQ
jgi:hypothetical protein